MFSDTYAALEKFDNSHDFERMCAAILLAQGYKEVVLMAPRGGPDEGQDIIFTMRDGSKGLACCTIRKDIDEKFYEDFSKRKPGEYKQYILFCTAYLTFEQKKKFSAYCLNKLNAIFLPQDIEVLRGLLDNAHQDIRESFLHIPDQSRLRQQETLTLVSHKMEAKELFDEAKQAMANYEWDRAETLMQLALQYFPLAEAPSYIGVQMSGVLIDAFKREHDLPPGYRLNTALYEAHGQQRFFAPPIERAMYWLERARKQNEEGEEKITTVEVLMALALMYSYSKNYDEMLACVKEAIRLSAATSRAFFKEPIHLAMLAYGCVEELDQAVALQKLGEELKLRLPALPQMVQHSISDSDYSICWIVMGKEDAWIGKPKPDFPMQLWIKTGYDGVTNLRIATYPNPHEPGKNTLIPPDGNGIPLDQLINQLADQFLFICHLPANPQYAP